MGKEDDVPRYYDQLGYEQILAKAIDRIALAVFNQDKGAVRGGVLALVHLMPVNTRKEIDKRMKDLDVGSLIGAVNEEQYEKLFVLWDCCTASLDSCQLLFKRGRGVQEYGKA